MPLEENVARLHFLALYLELMTSWILFYREEKDRGQLPRSWKATFQLVDC